MAAMLPTNTDVIWMAIVMLSMVAFCAAVLYLTRAREREELASEEIAALRSRLGQLEEHLREARAEV